MNYLFNVNYYLIYKTSKIMLIHPGEIQENLLVLGNII